MATALLDVAAGHGVHVKDLLEAESELVAERNRLLVALRAAKVKVPRLLEVSTGLSRTTVFEAAPKDVYTVADPSTDVDRDKRRLGEITRELVDLRTERAEVEELRDRAIIDAYDAGLFTLRASDGGVESVEDFAHRAGVVSQRVYQILEKAGRAAGGRS